MNTVSVDKIECMSIRTESDKNTCHMTGCTMLRGETILAIADEGNSCIKLIDVSKQRVIFRFLLSSSPWNITKVQLDHLAVSMPLEEKILLLTTTGETLSQQREIKVSGECRGIAHIEGRLFVSFTGPMQVQILSMSGLVLLTINTGPDGEPLFGSPQYVSISTDGSQLYVSDWKRSAVFCFDMTGKVKAIYKSAELEWPGGIEHVDGSRQIVCDSKAMIVHEISYDCTPGRVLLDTTYGIQKPECLAYSRVLSTLCISQCRNDEMKVLKLKSEVETKQK